MGRARQIALAATLGNLLQGWDNAAIAGALLYLKTDLKIEGNPLLEGIVVGSTLIGALASTICSGPGSDWLGRRKILCISAILYTLSALIMLWSPTVLVLIMARLLVGAGLGIAVTVVPIYIAETAPAEIRGQLSTLPQFMGSGGLFMAYTFCFLFSLDQAPNWRVMLALILVPALVYLVLSTFYLPESPRWLVSKGKMLEAKKVLQRLRNKTDVTAELSLLVEGLGVSRASLEEWLIEPIENTTPKASNGPESTHMLYTPQEGVSWVAKSLADPQRSTSFMDPMVAAIGSLNANISMENDENCEELDMERSENGDVENVVGDIDEQLLTAPLLPRPASSKVLLSRYNSKDGNNFHAHESASYTSRFVGQESEQYMSSVGIGSGWQLAWQWEEGQEGKKEGFKRVFLLQEGGGTHTPSVSAASLPHLDGDHITIDQPIQAAALVGQAAQSFTNIVARDVAGPAVVHPAETAVKGPAWADLCEIGVRRALLVGVLLQILQQFSGINAVLYFVPQILQQSGAAKVLASIGLGSSSASILASGITCLVMLPCIGLAMRFMDLTGRRKILLFTLPILFLSLLVMVISSTLIPAGVPQATFSFIGVTTYVCVFVMGFGPIPNILGSEIFPTRVRGLCIGICQASMWTCNILLTNMFPTLLESLGIGGLFGCFAVVVFIAWIFTFAKVPETKGMPLEVISEFFSMKKSVMTQAEDKSF